MNNKKLWAGRFSSNTHDLLNQFNASIPFDARLAEFDILGSIAHASMLGHCKIIPQEDAQRISCGLAHLMRKLQNDELHFTIDDEDIHMNIERLLHEEIGTSAGKLHTGRSRNDQVATDLHLFLRAESLKLIEKIAALQNALLQQAQQHVETLIPGYTHLQRAQPVRLAQHLLAYFNMLSRDIQRLQDSWPRINTLPLGAGAIAGSDYPVDRDYLAQLLGFDSLYQNSMDAVSDRDFVVEFLSNAALTMTHLSRLSEELILWSSQEFDFIELSDEFCTGSSMLPHKKNPDVPELVRGKTGRVYGALMAMLTVLKALPLSYNKDLQEDKEGLFDSLDTLSTSLEIFAPMIQKMHINKNTMYLATHDDYSGAMQIAKFLSLRNIPFRGAHHIAGEIVLHCLSKKISLHELPLTDYQTFHTAFDKTLLEQLKPENLVENYSVKGGTAKQSVLIQLCNAQDQLKRTQLWLDEKNKRLKTMMQT